MSTATATLFARPAPPLRGRLLTDAAVALSWVPFTGAGLLWRSDTEALAAAVTVTLVISFAHQPLTLALVYGDRRAFEARRRVFTWSPVVLALAIVAALHVSFTTLAIVAGLWNLQHTLMQRYGVARIHGRRAGEVSGRSEKALLIASLVFVLVWVAADGRTVDHLERAGMSGKDRRGVEVLADLRPIALVIRPVAFVVLVLACVAWAATETRRSTPPSTGKRLYLASTAVLFVAVVIDPVAGLLGFVGAHAVEYFAIVHRSFEERDQRSSAREPVERAVHRLGRNRFLLAYLCAVIAGLFAIRAIPSTSWASVVLLTIGGMHVLFDSLIWRTPTPVPVRVMP